MATDNWIFFTDLFGKQQWLRLDSQRNIVAESHEAFRDKQECVANARRHGYSEPQASPPTFAFLGHVATRKPDAVTCQYAAASGSGHA